MKRMILLVALCGPLPAKAQDVDCTNPTTQIEMTGCASIAYDAADADLNAVYKIARAEARRRDAAEPGLTPSNEVLLRDSQRAWIPFRDRACEAESTLARGGSMQNQLLYLCLERLTRARTQDLTIFANLN